MKSYIHTYRLYCIINRPRKRAAVGFGFAVEPLPSLAGLPSDAGLGAL
jgi:hypothetical protein